MATLSFAFGFFSCIELAMIVLLRNGKSDIGALLGMIFGFPTIIAFALLGLFAGAMGIMKESDDTRGVGLGQFGLALNVVALLGAIGFWFWLKAG